VAAVEAALGGGNQNQKKRRNLEEKTQ